MTRDRRGFTFVELIVVAVLGTLVVGAILQVLITNQRIYTAQAATVSGQQSTRMALEVLFNELREVSPADGDILLMTEDSVRVRLMRKFGAVCAVDLSIADPVLTIVRLSNIFGMDGSNVFDAGDSVFVYADNEEDTRADDVWVPASVTAVDTAGVVCPQDGTPAADLTFLGQLALFLPTLGGDSVGIGAPVRSYERFTFGTVTAFGDTYFSRRTGSSPNRTPVAGPIASTNGVDFIYRDELGAITTTAADVRQIEVIVRTGSGVLNASGEPVRDSITAWIYTRN